MKRSVEVWWGTNAAAVGTLHHDLQGTRESSAFEYDAAWLRDPDRNRELKTWISEDTGPEATIAALVSVRAYFQVREARAAAILREVEAAVARWRDEGRAIGMTAVELDAFTEAFEHAERAAARAAAESLVR